MAKPDWLKSREFQHPGFPRCVTCNAGGDPCGYTKNTGHGRMVMYRCRRHPSVVFYRETLACMDYERRERVPG